MMRRTIHDVLYLVAVGAIIAGCNDAPGPHSPAPAPGTEASTPGGIGDTDSAGSGDNDGTGRSEPGKGQDDVGDDSEGAPNGNSNEENNEPGGPATTNGVDFGTALGPAPGGGGAEPVPIRAGEGTVLYVTNSSTLVRTVTNVDVEDLEREDGEDFELAEDACTGHQLVNRSRCTVRIVYKRQGRGQRLGKVTFTADPGGSRELKVVGAGSQGVSATSKPTFQGGTDVATDPPRATPSNARDGR